MVDGSVTPTLGGVLSVVLESPTLRVCSRGTRTPPPPTTTLRNGNRKGKIDVKRGRFVLFRDREHDGPRRATIAVNTPRVSSIPSFVVVVVTDLLEMSRYTYTPPTPIRDREMFQEENVELGSNFQRNGCLCSFIETD